MQADFPSLVREHQDLVFSIAYHFLRDPEDAEELAQEVFLELHRRSEPFESPTHTANWLRKVASRRCIDFSRSRARHPQRGLEDANEPVHQPLSADPLLATAIRSVLAALPEKQRLVVLLRYGEDLDPSEIADTLEMPVNTVKSYLQRSLQTLREKLERRKITQ